MTGRSRLIIVILPNQSGAFQFAFLIALNNLKRITNRGLIAITNFVNYRSCGWSAMEPATKKKRLTEPRSFMVVVQTIKILQAICVGIPWSIIDIIVKPRTIVLCIYGWQCPIQVKSPNLTGGKDIPIHELESLRFTGQISRFIEDWVCLYYVVASKNTPSSSPFLLRSTEAVSIITRSCQGYYLYEDHYQLIQILLT